VVRHKNEDLAEMDKFLQCCRPNATDGSWVDACNNRLGSLLQETNLDVFLADDFWPANVQILKGGAGEEDMAGSDAGDIAVTIHPHLTSDQLEPVAFKIVYARDKWVADQIASSGLGQPGHLKTARGGGVGGGAALSAPIGGGVSSGYLNNGVPPLPQPLDPNNIMTMNKRIKSYQDEIFPSIDKIAVGLAGITATDSTSQSIRLEPKQLPIYEFILQVEHLLLLIGGCYCHSLTTHSTAELAIAMRDQIWQQAHLWKKMSAVDAQHWTGVLPLLVTDRKTEYLFLIITRWIKSESPVRMWERFKEVISEVLAFDRSYEKLLSASSGKQRDCIAIQVMENWWDRKEVDRVDKKKKRKSTDSQKTGMFQAEVPKSARGRAPLPDTTRPFSTVANYYETPETWIAFSFYGAYNDNLPPEFPKLRDMHVRSVGGGPLPQERYQTRDSSSTRDAAKYRASPAGASILGGSGGLGSPNYTGFFGSSQVTPSKLDMGGLSTSISSGISDLTHSMEKQCEGILSVLQSRQSQPPPPLPSVQSQPQITLAFPGQQELDVLQELLPIASSTDSRYEPAYQRRSELLFEKWEWSKKAAGTNPKP
jgi:hypothetical protein